MNPIQVWHAAERAFDDDARFEELVATLPVRLEWLIRAVRALDRGRPEDIASALEALDATGEDHPDVRALLASAGGESADLDGLDPAIAGLIRVMGDAIDHNDEDEAPEELIAVARSRVVLGGVLQTLLGSFDRIGRSPRFFQLMPRGEQLRVAGQLFQRHGSVNASTLGQAFPELLVNLDPERWPDMAVGPELLVSWLRGDGEWSRRHALAMRSAEALPEEPQRALIGAFVDRIHTLIGEGKLHDLAAPTFATSQVAEVAGLTALARELDALHLKLRWLDEDEPTGDLLQSLWVYGDLDTESRSVVAKTLLAHPPEEPNPSIMVQSQLHLLAHLESASEAAGVLETGASRAPREMLERGLEEMGASAVRRALMLALHSAHNGDASQALVAAGELAETHDQPDAALIVISLVVEMAAAGKVEAASITGPLQTALSALDGVVLDVDQLVLLLADLRAIGEVPATLGETVKRSLEGLDASGKSQAARVVSLAMIGDEADAKAAMREVGRKLRELDGNAADDLAAETLAWILFWGHESDRESLLGHIKPVSRFLTRDGAERAAAAAVRGADAGRSQLRGLVQWYLWEREALGEDGRWLDLCCRVTQVPPALEELGLEIVGDVLGESPSSVEDLDRQVRARLQRMMMSGIRPG